VSDVTTKSVAGSCARMDALGNGSDAGHITRPQARTHARTQDIGGVSVTAAILSGSGFLRSDWDFCLVSYEGERFCVTAYGRTGKWREGDGKDNWCILFSRT